MAVCGHPADNVDFVDGWILPYGVFHAVHQMPDDAVLERCGEVRLHSVIEFGNVSESVFQRGLQTRKAEIQCRLLPEWQGKFKSMRIPGRCAFLDGGPPG